MNLNQPFFRTIIVCGVLGSLSISTLLPRGKQGQIAFGVAVNHTLLQTNHNYTAIVKHYFNSLTPGNEMKWDAIQKEKGKFTFEDADYIVKFASDNNQQVNAHTILWHRQAPDWVKYLPKSEMAEAIKTHINKFIEHFKGKIVSLDVCNEIFEEDGNFRQSFWYNTLGDYYPELALRTARNAAPDLKLYVNDYSNEGVNSKSNAMLKFAKKMKDLGILDGIGFQCHLQLGQVPSDLQTNLQRFVEAGLEVAITELDIRINLGGDRDPTDDELKQQKEDFSKVVKACLNVKGCKRVTIWGVFPQDSWVPQEYPGLLP
ncbi:hypothetical protein CROQUDRAFT_52653 [Cronartium quercuum f. sp. fusiforme G11]|uniref:Beta-xylanase n=1 Tax=Cronartium quercuum f. sp. fusiforme G11 TaxID=708437 RepID=A0A9P6T7U7_9BASI|nr:hypothetical protein CROQUDRAFT_52653 [Cronartium quercuum f. sp. fusiforme G11]